MDQRFIQCLATVILFFGALCIGAADKYNWHDLASAGETIIGVGAGILTGHAMSNTRTDAGTINLIGPPDPKA